MNQQRNTHLSVCTAASIFTCLKFICMQQPIKLSFKNTSKYFSCTLSESVMRTIPEGL